eukprot:GDKI01044182.1.p1 GENE.GDKI01044182.1~~GDKI01044182.1.p1  ORF type:complete len:245 (-),score=83.85 GDKI01044182.1:28-762(-)
MLLRSNPFSTGIRSIGMSLGGIRLPHSAQSVYRDSALLVVLLFVIIPCGVLLHVYKQDKPWLAFTFVLIAFLLSGILQLLFTAQLVQTNDLWTHKKCRLFAGVSFFGGVCSGLLGVGGGLIFSPFFVAMKIDPTVTVATAAACVIFTSTSTTLQYLLIGRMMIDYALFFGAFALIASYFGTRLVHWVTLRYGRQSYVVMIVGLAVFMSSVLTILKAVALVEHPEQFSGAPSSSSGGSCSTCATS